MRISTIYSIHDPDTDELRYIGNTSHKLYVRLSQHKYRARRGSTSLLHQWIRTLSKSPVIKQIAVVDRDSSDELEELLISEYRRAGKRLLNIGAGGSGIKGARHSEETKAKIGLAGLGRKMPPKSAETLRRMSEAQKQSCARRKLAAVKESRIG